MTTWRLTVEGHDWVVRDRAGEPGVHDFDWLTGPNAYGITSARADHGQISEADMTESIADFLTQINPETGYLD